MSICSVCTWAQAGLNINDIFEGKVVSRKFMNESIIQGESLKAYSLDVLRTVKFTATEKERDEVERLFMLDIEPFMHGTTDNIELEKREEHLYYAIVQIANAKKGDEEKNKYICYQCRKNAKMFDITVVYMKGEATMLQLRDTFRKK